MTAKNGTNYLTNYLDRTLACHSLSAFHSFDFANIVQRFRKLDHRGVLGVHLEEVDQMRSARAVENAFFNQENRITERVTIEHGAAHAAAGACAGHEQAVDI